MQQNFSGGMPPRVHGPKQPGQETAASSHEGVLAGAAALGELIRSEHGRAGVSAFVTALNPLIPYDFLERLCNRLHTGLPERIVQQEPVAPPPPPPKNNSPAIKPEQLLNLMQMKGKGAGGLDPATLIKLFNQK